MHGKAYKKTRRRSAPSGFPLAGESNALRPDDERDDSLSITEVALENLRSAAAGGLHQLSPLRGRLQIRAAHRRRTLQSRCRVEVRVDNPEFVVIVLVRMFVVELAIQRAIRVVRVVHAGAEIRVVEGRVLVIETKRVADLLARNKLFPGVRVVLCSPEVRIVQLYRPLGDMAAAHPD